MAPLPTTSMRLPKRSYLPADGFALGPRPVVLDVGANIGMFSAFCAVEWPDATIHAFEPVPDVHRVLRRNVARLLDAHAHCLAVGERSGETTLRYYPQFTMLSGADADPAKDLATVRSYVLDSVRDGADAASYAMVEASPDEILRRRLEQRAVTCRVEPLAALVPDLGCPLIDLLKVDAEGSELAVLHGLDDATWALVRHAPVEVDDVDGRVSTVRALFDAHGLHTAATQGPAYRNTGLYLVHAWR